MSWITHRAPTPEDADGDGYVIIPNKKNAGCFAVSRWDEVAKGEAFAPYPGRPEELKTPEEPVTRARKFKQVTSNQGYVGATAIADDDTAWFFTGSGLWVQYPSLPDRK